MLKIVFGPMRDFLPIESLKQSNEHLRFPMKRLAQYESQTRLTWGWTWRPISAIIENSLIEQVTSQAL
jgi:hypothetical protein